MDKEFSFDNTILGEECDVMFNQHMSQRELKLIDSLIEVYADGIENIMGYGADSIRKGEYEKHGECHLMMRFAVLLFEFRKSQQFLRDLRGEKPLYQRNGNYLNRV
jgi:hypothetical protein|tara:strand:+ start:337 stop:654 length:318 start_codon:yes stop_codon:yes gene_type:complete